jgi:hypothetical protein
MAPWDVFILLDGGYRITEGQVPSTDFSNAIGPLVYGLVSVGMRLQQVPSLAAVEYGNLIFVGIASILAWIVARRRVPAPYAAGFTAFAALLVVSVRPLGYSPWTTTYAMLYNRYGWVLYATLLILVLIRPRGQGARGVVADGLVLGLLLGLLFYCKANFFAVGVLAVGVGVALSTLARRTPMVLGGVAGFLAVAVTMRLGFGVRVSDYLGDLVAAAHAQRDGQRLSMLAHSVLYNIPVGLLALAVVGGLLVSARRRRAATAGLWRLSAAGAYVFGSSVVVSAADTAERYELPALVVLALLLVAHRPPGAPRLTRPSLIGLAALLLATAGPIAGKDVLGLGKAVALRGVVSHPVVSQRFDSDHLRDFVVPSDSTWPTAYRTANLVPHMINDGMALLRRHIAPSDTVFTVSLTNPFSFAMSLPPSRGAPLWWDLGISFDRTSHPAPGALDDAHWVMIPRTVPGQGCCQETVQTMLELYGPYLAEHFAESERTSDWILLARVR